MDSFQRQLGTDSEEVEGDFSVRHGTLRVSPDQRRFWTPCLELTVEELVDEPTDELGSESPDRSRLWGTFTPRPEIWTGFVFATGVLVIVSIFSSVYGIAQLALGHRPDALIIPAICIALAGGLYLSALIGQGLSLSEMYRLRVFVDDSLRQAESSAPDPEA